MSFVLGSMGPSGSRSSHPRSARPDDYDEQDSLSPTSAMSTHSSQPRTRAPFTSSPSLHAIMGPNDLPNQTDFLSASGQAMHTAGSVCSTTLNTPVPSRSNSPLPRFYSPGPSSVSTSDTDSEPGSPLLGDGRRGLWLGDERRRWWSTGPFRRRRRRESRWSLRAFKKMLKRVVRHPLFPRQPITILLTLLLLTLLALSITFLLMHVLNPDKEPLPWRAYCAAPPTSPSPPSLSSPPVPFDMSSISSGPSWQPFPPNDFDSLPPAGVFVGVFSVDSSFDRRMLVRTTWLSHQRSRNGAGKGDGGDGTSRTIVRFVLGQPRKAWERRIRLEMEKYNDIIILPVSENMNSGKTHAFFSWAANDSWVPPLYFNTDKPPPQFSYSNISHYALPLAGHDPPRSWADAASGYPREWVRPDYIVKADDDSFIMLAELEARLRMELHQSVKAGRTRIVHPEAILGPSVSREISLTGRDEGSTASSTSQDSSLAGSSSDSSSGQDGPSTSTPPEPRFPGPSPYDDPLIYWGYLVKGRFMAGEMYALSWSLVDWVAKSAVTKGLTRGAEDKQTAKWMRLHPRASEVRWTSDRCWIYDHPRSGTVYSHGFLFPSEVARVRRGIMSYFDRMPQEVAGGASTIGSPSANGANQIEIPSAWSRSTVSKFGSRYAPPLPDLTTEQSVEALVEGSDMSLLHEGSILTPEDAWRQREGRKTRYQGQRVGGTVVVHFIKQNMWYLETAIALLEGDEETELDILRNERQYAETHPYPERPMGSRLPASHKPRPASGSSAMSPPVGSGFSRGMRRR